MSNDIQKPLAPLKERERRFRTYLVLLAFVLFSVFVTGLAYMATTPTETVGLTLSYTAGLSMIVLPCTLPLVFVIVPLCMGENYRKGFIMALLFGGGLTITLTAYAIAIALAGNWLGLDQATRIMLLIAGVAAWIFGVAELGLFTIKFPTYSGRKSAYCVRVVIKAGSRRCLKWVIN